MHVQLPQCVVRDWRESDKASLIRFGNSRDVWRNLTDAFPHPYTEADADRWFSFLATRDRRSHFAIEVEGQAVGGIGADPLDGIFSTTAEFGYWLGDPFWGKGIATAAGSIVVPHVMESLSLHRLEAAVFEWNPASMRVLEKLGFAREGVLRRSAVKEGRVIDRMMYALVDGPGRS